MLNDKPISGLTAEQVKVLEEASSSNDILILGGDTTLDISDQGAACDTYQIDSLTSLDSIDLSGITTITLPSSSMSYTGSGGYSSTTCHTISSNNCYTINTGSSYSGNGISWSTISPNPPVVEIDNSGINVKGNGDIKVGDISLKEFMKTMQDRLSILVPDPEKLEKFEALKKAYEHYKTMEALCFPEKEEENK